MRSFARTLAVAVIIGCAAACNAAPRTDSAAGTDERFARATPAPAPTPSASAPSPTPAVSSPPTSSAPASSAPISSAVPTTAIPVPTGTPLQIDPRVIGQTVAVDIGGSRRTYDVVLPPHPLAARLPVVVILAGSGAPVSDEEQRTGLLPEVEAGKLILVYPVDDVGSWGMGPCCGRAQRLGIDDIPFITTVLAQVAARPDVLPGAIVLGGYSNGARMAFVMACREPTVVRALVTVAGTPVMACPPGAPVPLLEMGGVDDPEVAFTSGDPRHWLPGFEEPTVIGEAATWNVRNGCSATAVQQTKGAASLTTWSACTSGAPVEVVGYRGVQHLWPNGDANTPSGATVILGFMTMIGIDGL